MDRRDEAIGKALRIVYHCLEYFPLRGMPQSYLIDQGERIDLLQVFQEEFSPETSTPNFEVQDHTVTIADVFIRSAADTSHALKFCADNRVVKTE